MGFALFGNIKNHPLSGWLHGSNFFHLRSNYWIVSLQWDMLQTQDTECRCWGRYLDDDARESPQAAGGCRGGAWISCRGRCRCRWVCGRSNRRGRGGNDRQCGRDASSCRDAACDPCVTAGASGKLDIPPCALRVLPRNRGSAAQRDGTEDVVICARSAADVGNRCGGQSRTAVLDKLGGGRRGGSGKRGGQTLLRRLRCLYDLRTTCGKCTSAGQDRKNQYKREARINIFHGSLLYLVDVLQRSL